MAGQIISCCVFDEVGSCPVPFSRGGESCQITASAFCSAESLSPVHACVVIGIINSSLSKGAVPVSVTSAGLCPLLATKTRETKASIFKRCAVMEPIWSITQDCGENAIGYDINFCIISKRIPSAGFPVVVRWFQFGVCVSA